MFFIVLAALLHYLEGKKTATIVSDSMAPISRRLAKPPLSLFAMWRRGSKGDVGSGASSSSSSRVSLLDVLRERHQRYQQKQVEKKKKKKKKKKPQSQAVLKKKKKPQQQQKTEQQEPETMSGAQSVVAVLSRKGKKRQMEPSEGEEDGEEESDFEIGKPLESPAVAKRPAAVAKRPAAAQGMVNASEDLLGDSLETPQTVVAAGASSQDSNGGHGSLLSLMGELEGLGAAPVAPLQVQST